MQGTSIDRDEGGVVGDSAMPSGDTEAGDITPTKRRCAVCAGRSDAGGEYLCNSFGADEDYDCPLGSSCCLDTRSCQSVGGVCLDLLPQGGCAHFGPPTACPRASVPKPFRDPVLLSPSYFGIAPLDTTWLKHKPSISRATHQR